MRHGNNCSPERDRKRDRFRFGDEMHCEMLDARCAKRNQRSRADINHGSYRWRTCGRPVSRMLMLLKHRWPWGEKHIFNSLAYGSPLFPDNRIYAPSGRTRSIKIADVVLPVGTTASRNRYAAAQCECCLEISHPCGLCFVG